MDTFYNRFVQLCSEQNKAPTAIAKQVGITSGAVTKWSKGGNANDATILRLAKYFNVSFYWLKTGEGAREKQAEKPILPDAMPMPEGNLIPILGTVRCGTPMYAEENTTGYINYDGNYGEQYFCLRATGDSMNAAGISPGDLIVVRRQDIVDQNDIAVVCVNGNEATLKRFVQKGDTVTLIPQSTNPENKILTYNVRETPIHVIGRVMECRKKF